MANILNDGVVFLKFIGLYILASQVAVGLGCLLFTYTLRACQ